MNKPPYIVTSESISVVWDGKPYTVKSDHANYKPLYTAILNGQWSDIGQFLSVEKSIADFSSGKISVKNGEVFYGSHQLHGVVVDKLLQFLREGSKDANHIINFISRLMANPSSNSVGQLYTFLSYKALPITESGNVIGYRGIRDDWYSKHGNTQTVVLRGKVNKDGQIYNGIGEVIEIQRNSVDDNKNNHCSYGLHVGSYDYARDWAGSDGRVIMVEFDPADAVSVPTDCDFQKLRVSKYKVIAEIPREKLNKNSAPLAKASYNTSQSINIEEDTDDVDQSSDQDLNIVKLAIKNYVNNRWENNNAPTIKQIQSRLKNGYTSEQIKDVCTNLGFSVQEDENGSLSNSFVYPACGYVGGYELDA